MNKTSNIRAKKVGSNFEEFKANHKDASDIEMDFSEELEDTHHRLADLKIWDYLALFFSMLADSFNRKYPVPKKTVLVMTFSLLYLISPVDLLPDIVPLLGFADDIALIAFASSLIKSDLKNYRAWKMSY